jgi:glycogen phosphorylase
MDIKALHNGLPRQLLKDLPKLRSDAATIANDIRRNFAHTFGCNRHSEAAHTIYKSLAITLRDRLMKHWNRTTYSYEQSNCKGVYFLSMEYLMGRTLGNAMSNLGITEETSKALQSLSLWMEEIIETERESGLGNAGLGRFASCNGQQKPDTFLRHFPIKFSLKFQRGLVAQF